MTIGQNSFQEVSVRGEECMSEFLQTAHKKQLHKAVPCLERRLHLTMHCPILHSLTVSHITAEFNFLVFVFSVAKSIFIGNPQDNLSFGSIPFKFS